MHVVCVCCVCLCNVFVLMCVSVLRMYIRMVWHPGIRIGILEDMTYQIVLLLSVCVRICIRYMCRNHGARGAIASLIISLPLK